MCAVICSFLCQIEPSFANDIKHVYFQSSDGIKLHYLDAGKGKTLIFIPGWTMPASIWEKQIIYFSKRYHVIAFDPRSQGLSEIATKGHNSERRARDIEELISHLDSDSVVVIGWSLGVCEVLSYMKLFGEKKVSGVVLVDNSIGEGPPGKGKGKGKNNLINMMKTDRFKATYLFVKSMYKKQHDEEYYKYITYQAMKTPTKIAHDLLINLYPRDVWKETIDNLRLPLLYVVTSKFRSQANILKNIKPEAWTEVFDSAGHALFVDEEERFNTLLLKFLTEKVWRHD